MAKNLLFDIYNKKKDTEQPFKLDTSLEPTVSPEVTNTQPVNALTKYWGQPVVGNLPLDQFVTLAGTTAHALDPTGFGGRLGKDIASMGSAAYGERMKREYETPNKLLQRQLLTAQINKIRAEQPGKWEAMLRYGLSQGMDVPEILDLYTKKTTTTKPTYKYFQDNEGNISGFVNGQLAFGSGKGKDITEEVSKAIPDNRGNITLISKAGTVMGTIPKIGKTASGSSSVVERTYEDYKKDFMQRLIKGDTEGLLTNEQGQMMTPWEFQKYMQQQVDPIKEEMLNWIKEDQEKEKEKPSFWSNLFKGSSKEETKTKPVVKPKIQFTEEQIRSMLKEKQKTDPSIDVDRDVEYYRSIGAIKE